MTCEHLRIEDSLLRLPAVHAVDEPEMPREEAERLRAEIARSPDFIRDLVLNDDECIAVSGALVAGDHAALARTIRAALERSLDEEIERYRFTCGHDQDGALESVHRLYAGGDA